MLGRRNLPVHQSWVSHSTKAVRVARELNTPFLMKKEQLLMPCLQDDPIDNPVYQPQQSQQGRHLPPAAAKSDLGSPEPMAKHR